MNERLEAEIQTNWPVFYAQLEFIVEHSNPTDIFIVSVCSILDQKISYGDTSYRGILLKIKEKMRTDDTALKETFLNLFIRSCTQEDIPLLLLTLASNRNLDCKVLAARGLVRVGDAAALKEMHRILTDLTEKEPERYADNKKRCEKALRIIMQQQDVVVPDVKPTYLDDIAREIKKLEKRLSDQCKNPAAVLRLDHRGSTDASRSSTTPSGPATQETSSNWKVILSGILILLLSGGIFCLLRKRVGRR